MRGLHTHLLHHQPGLVLPNYQLVACNEECSPDGQIAVNRRISSLTGSLLHASTHPSYAGITKSFYRVGQIKGFQRSLFGVYLKSAPHRVLIVYAYDSR